MNKTLIDKDGKQVKKLSKDMKVKRKAAFEAISKKAILVNMTRKQIANLPFDIKLADKICKDYGVKQKSYIQVRKCIFNPQYLINIRALVSDALLMVWNNTRPWDNVGYRILPMSHYDDFNKTFGKIKDEFEEAVQLFIDNYDVYVAEAKKDLGSTWDKSNYPDKATLSQHFLLDIQTSQFPDINDIRLNLSNDELVDMQDDYVKKYDDVIRSSIKDLIALIDNGDKDEAMKLFSLIKTLNVVNDPSLDLQIKTFEEQIKIKFSINTLESKKTDDNPDDMMIMNGLDDLDDEELDGFQIK